MGNPVSRFQKPGIQNRDRSFYNGIRRSALKLLLALYNRMKGAKRQCFLNMTESAMLNIGSFQHRARRENNKEPFSCSYLTEFNLCVLCALCGKLV